MMMMDGDDDSDDRGKWEAREGVHTELGVTWFVGRGRWTLKTYLCQGRQDKIKREYRW